MRTALVLALASAPLLMGQVANQGPNGFCKVDGIQFPFTIAGLQAAVNNVNCFDITVAAGNTPPYSGAGNVHITRSGVHIHGAGGGEGYPNYLGATVLSFGCLQPAIVVGDGVQPMGTYGRIQIEDLTIQLPAGCTNDGLRVKASAAGSVNSVRRVRITEVSGNSTGNAVHLEPYVWGWTFDDVTIDHFSNGYLLDGFNHFVRITGGECFDNNICFNAENDSPSQNVVLTRVDIEVNAAYGVDVFSAQGLAIRDCYFDNNVRPNARAIRLGAKVGDQVQGATIVGNLFNGGSANYAIEIGPAGFSGLHIHDNHFIGYMVGNVLNNSSSGKHGTYFANDSFYIGSGPELSSEAGFDLVTSTR